MCNMLQDSSCQKANDEHFRANNEERVLKFMKLLEGAKLVIMKKIIKKEFYNELSRISRNPVGCLILLQKPLHLCIVLPSLLPKKYLSFKLANEKRFSKNISNPL